MIGRGSNNSEALLGCSMIPDITTYYKQTLLGILCMQAVMLLDQNQHSSNA